MSSNSPKGPALANLLEYAITVAMTSFVTMAILGDLHSEYQAVPPIGFWTAVDFSVLLVAAGAVFRLGSRD